MHFYLLFKEEKKTRLIQMAFANSYFGKYHARSRYE